MATEFDIDKLLAAAQEAVANPAAASKTSTESLLVIVDPAAAPQTPLAAAAPAPKPPLAPAPKWPHDQAPKTPPDDPAPPWRSTPSSATAAKTRDPRPATVPDPRRAKIGKQYAMVGGKWQQVPMVRALVGGKWQQVRNGKPCSSASKAGVVFPAVPPAARPVAPSKAGRVAARVVAPPPAKANAPAKARPPVKAAAPAKAVAPAPAPVETPAPAEAHAPAAAPAKTAAAPAKTAACPFKALGIPLPPPAVVRPALDAHVAPASEAVLAAAKKRHGPRGNNENSQWHTAMHLAKQQGPKALFEFFRDWPKPLKKQKTQPDA